jgi:hypothetical protein
MSAAMMQAMLDRGSAPPVDGTLQDTQYSSSLALPQPLAYSNQFNALQQRLQNVTIMASAARIASRMHKNTLHAYSCTRYLQHKLNTASQALTYIQRNINPSSELPTYL